MQRTTLALALLAVSTAANAGDFDYNYVSVGYGNMSLDEVDVDGDGFGVGASFALTDSYHVFAGYEIADLDDTTSTHRRCRSDWAGITAFHRSWTS